VKAFLLNQARDFAWRAEADPGYDDLVQDLGVNTLLAAMAKGDRFLFEVARQVLLTSVQEPDAIRFRQAVLRDCIANTDAIKELYALAVEAIASERKVLFGFGANASPEMIVNRSVHLLELLVGMLRQLRAFSDTHGEAFESDGFRRFYAMIADELSDDYLRSLDDHLKQLEFRRGVLMSAHLGKGNKGVGYLLRRAQNVPRGVRARLAAAVTRAPGYSFQIADRDEAGARALGVLRDRGLNSVANAAAQSSDHVLSFFRMLRGELAFYIGCLNLRDTLTAKGEPTTVPEPTAAAPPALTFRNLRDVGLALRTDEPVVGNDVDADERTLLIVTGANQGGKSTFLRSVGLAQLMMQAGMFVVADTFRASVCSGVMTHFVREEDATMTSGKLDEELARMSTLAERLAPRTLMLFNESFSATNEREGSEISRQIIRALRDAQIKVAFVTHMYDLAHGFYAAQDRSVLFLRAERLEDERRTFKIVEAEPERTSHGEDLYHRIFDAPDRPANLQNGGHRTAVTSPRTPA
jgi:hypothetical protein